MTPGTGLTILVIGVTGIGAQVLLLRELFLSFLGNEFTLGVVLGCWILAEALGALWGSKFRWSSGRVYFFQGAFCLSVLGGLALARTLKPLLFTPWRLGGYGEILAVALGSSCLPAFFHGALFPGCCWLAGERVGMAYFFETLGTVLGALTFGYLLLGHLEGIQISLFFLLLSLPLGINLLGRKGWYSVIALGMVIGALPFCPFWERKLLEARWPGYRIERTSHSPYAHLALLSRGEEKVLLCNGVPLLTLPEYDPWIAPAVHLPLLLHRDPKDVLFIGPALGGRIKEALKHPLEQVDWVERDSALIDLLRGLDALKEELQEPRLRVIQDDPRQWLRKGKRYDLIFVSLELPSDLQSNRLFTEEALDLIKRSLRPGGILVYELEGAPVYMGEGLQGAFCTLFSTLKMVFPFVRLIMAEKALAIASDSPLSMDPKPLLKKLSSLEPLSPLVPPQGISYLLSREYPLPSPSPPNRDERPFLVYRTLQYQEGIYGPVFSRILRPLEKLNPPWLFSCLLPGIGLLFLSPKRKVSAAIATTGLAAMGGELLLLYLFQISYGALYLWMGLLLSSFMSGAAVGALLGRGKGRWSRLVMAEALLFAFLGFLSFSLEIPRLLYLCLLALLGGFGGWEFSVGSIVLGEGREVGGRLYFWDLLGGLIAAFSLPTVFLPLWGLKTTALFLMAIKGLSFLALMRI